MFVWWLGVQLVELSDRSAVRAEKDEGIDQVSCWIRSMAGPTLRHKSH